MVVSERADTGRTWQLLAEMLVSITAFGAILYFFGRARTEAMFVALGALPDQVALSATEYAVRGVEVALPLAVVTTVVVLAGCWGHRVLVRPALTSASHTLRHRMVRRVLKALAVLGVLGLVLVGVGVLMPDQVGRPLGLALPVTLAAGAGLLAYVVASRAVADRRAVLALAMLAALGGVWTGALYAEPVGQRFADHFVTVGAQQRGVVVFSRERLSIAGPGVTVQPIGLADSKYRFCYLGLSKLVQSDREYVLAAPGRRRGTVSLHPVPIGNDVRIEPRPSDAAPPAVCAPE